MSDRDEDYARHERDYRGRERDRDEGIERWQGGTEAQITAMGVTITTQAATIGQIQDRMTEMQIQMATLKTQIGVWSAVGGLIGAGIVSVIVFFVTGHAGH